LVVEDELLGEAAALAAVLGRPADAEPPVTAHLPDRLQAMRAPGVAPFDLGLDLGGHELGEVGAQLGAQRLLLRCVGDVHGEPCAPAPALLPASDLAARETSGSNRRQPRATGSPYARRSRRPTPTCELPGGRLRPRVVGWHDRCFIGAPHRPR